ncbi:MAG: cupin domain-containing protein [Steroidobacteraceae bacterium]
MARPWIEFVQSQKLPWQAGDLWGVRAGTEIRMLSLDANNGASSLLVRYPAEWRLENGGALSADEEFLVLDGALSIGSQTYREKSYAHLPAGYTRAPMASKAGAVVLTFFSVRPNWTAPTGFDHARLVEHLDAFAVPYTARFHPEFPPGAGRKTLYEDPVTHDQTWILGTLPMRWAERAEVHPVAEEMYLLSGESHGNRGVMRPGAYFWRPPQVPHGPYGTLTGNLYFFRTSGGALSTNYVDVARPFRWWPDYDPVLPDALAAARGEAAKAPQCW